MKNFLINDIETFDGKIFVTSPQNLSNLKFIFDGREYMFAERGKIYEIRKLSKTCNSNVIFSIQNKF